MNLVDIELDLMRNLLLDADGAWTPASRLGSVQQEAVERLADQLLTALPLEEGSAAIVLWRLRHIEQLLPGDIFERLGRIDRISRSIGSFQARLLQELNESVLCLCQDLKSMSGGVDFLHLEHFILQIGAAPHGRNAELEKSMSELLTLLKEQSSKDPLLTILMNRYINAESLFLIAEVAPVAALDYALQTQDPTLPSVIINKPTVVQALHEGHMTALAGLFSYLKEKPTWIVAHQIVLGNLMEQAAREKVSPSAIISLLAKISADIRAPIAMRYFEVCDFEAESNGATVIHFLSSFTRHLVDCHTASAAARNTAQSPRGTSQ